MTFVTRYLALRKGGATQRWHTKQPLRSQTVGEHSFNAALLAVALWGDGASGALLRWCLTHDLAEQVVGDVPSPVLRAVPQLKTAYAYAEGHVEQVLGVDRYTVLPPDEAVRAKLLDYLEVVFYAAEQIRLGQRTDFAPIMQLTWNWVKASPVIGVDVAQEIVSEIDDFVRGTIYPTWRCDRCGEFAHVETGEDGLRWCLPCRSHDIGTIMAARVATEQKETRPPFVRPLGVHDVPSELVRHEELVMVDEAAGYPLGDWHPLGNDDPHDPPRESLFDIDEEKFMAACPHARTFVRTLVDSEDVPVGMVGAVQPVAGDEMPAHWWVLYRTGHTILTARADLRIVRER